MLGTGSGSSITFSRSKPLEIASNHSNDSARPALQNSNVSNPDSMSVEASSAQPAVQSVSEAEGFSLIFSIQSPRILPFQFF